MIDLIELAGAVLVIVLGTLALAGGDLTLGGLLAFLAYLAQLYRPVRDVSRLGQTIFEASAGAERVIELLDTRAARDRPAGRARARARPRMARARARHLHVSRARERPALEDLSLPCGRAAASRSSARAAPASRRPPSSPCASPTPTTAPSGSTGTTSATSRCARCARTSACSSRTRRCSTARSARTSPTAARPPTSRCARRSRAVGLPLDPATRTGQRGRALSGGERRRVAMARVLLQDAPVLVLDEPSAGLDADATRRLLEPLRRVMARPRRPAHHPRPDPHRGGRRGRRAAPHGPPRLSPDRAPQPHAPVRHLRGVERGPRVLVRGQGRARGPARRRARAPGADRRGHAPARPRPPAHRARLRADRAIRSRRW